MNRILLVATLLLNGIALWFGWNLFSERRRAEVMRESIPPIPDLKALPRLFGDRVRLGSVAACNASGGPPAALEELAMLYHANGFTRQAERLELGLQRLEPKEARWPYYLADLRLTQGDVAGAEQFLRTSLQLDPNNAAGVLKLANLFLRTGRTEEAISRYTQRLHSLPDDPYAQLGLARVAIQQGRWQDATLLLRGLLAKNPHFYTAHNLLAEISELSGDLPSAEQSRLVGAGSARFHDADDPLMSQMQAWSYDPYQLQVQGAIDMQSGRLVESLPYYEKSVRIDPQDGTGYDALGDVLIQLGHLEEARGVLESGIVAAPGMASLYTALAQVFRKQGRPQEAVKLLRSAVAHLPRSPEIYNDLGVSLEEAGLQSEAAAAYFEAIRLNADFAEAHLNLGLCLDELDRRGEAEQHFRIALELRPANRNALLASAKADLTAGRWETGRRRLEMLLALDPNRPDVLNLLAIAHLRLGLEASKAGRTEEAERQFLAGLASDPNLAELQANEGVLLIRRNEAATATEYFQRFVTLAPDDPIAYFYLGEALLVTHRPAEAEKILTQGLAVAQRTGNAQVADQIRSVLDLAHGP